MTQDIFLMSVDELKQNSTIDMNVEDKILETSILDSQNIDIQGIIGTKLYKILLNMVDTGTVKGDYKTLLDEFIFPTQLKFALYRSIMPMRVHFRNKGVMENNSNNSQPVDKEFINYVENKIRNDVEFYANKLKGYLCYHFDKYPNDKNDLPTDRKDYNKPNRDDAYFSGIYLG